MKVQALFYAIWAAVLTGSVRAAFMVQPESTAGIKSETVTLKCQITNESGAIVVWYKNKAQLSIDRNLVDSLDHDVRSRYSVVGNRNEGEFNLQILNVKPSDEGQYYCSYISRAGGGTSAIGTITVLIPPSDGYPRCTVYAETPQNGETSFWPGEKASLSCQSAGGDPSANLTWYRKNWTVSEPTKRRNVYRRILSPGDNGITFVCEATSPALREPRRCTVTPMSIPPEVHVRPLSASVLVGDNVTFHCEVSAITRVQEYNWYIKGTLVSAETNGINFTSNGKMMVISDVQMNLNRKPVECEAVIENDLRSRARTNVEVIPPKKTPPPASTPTQKVTVGEVEVDETEIPTSSGGPLFTADMNLIIVVVSGSLIVLLLLIAIIMGCWVFGFRQPRRPNTRVNIDYGEVPADMSLDGISHYSMPAAMFSTELPESHNNDVIRNPGNIDENAPGFISALYATLDKNKKYPVKMTSASSLPEKPIAQITPTSSKAAISHFASASGLEKRKSTGGAIALSDLKDSVDDPSFVKGCSCKDELEKEDPNTEQ